MPNEEKIAVEIQSFTGPSPVADLPQALGRFATYRVILAGQEPGQAGRQAHATANSLR